MNPHGEQRTTSSGFVTGLSIGLGIGLLLSCLISAAGVFYVKREATNVRKGWNLVPVVVAAVDIKENTTITFDQISQRSVPEQFVTGSVVKPDSASYVVNQKVLVPLLAGDMLLWSQFETTPKK
jgi:pilus assembly protein CpaB